MTSAFDLRYSAPAMLHPVRKMIESLHAKGACPRIQVDLTVERVVCPDFVRDQWKEKLVIDLDPTYPLDLAFTEDGVEADLSFDGFVTRCVFPFDSIYVVSDRATQKGIVIEQNMPSSVRRKAKLTSVSRTELDAKAGGKRDRASRSRRRRRPKAKPELQAAPEPVDHAPTRPEPAAVADAPDVGQERTGDEEAQRRRSVFKVIDGDG